MTVPLRPRLAGRDKNVTIVVVVETPIPKGVTAAELEVETSVLLADAETEIGVDVVEVRDGSDKEVICSSRVDPIEEKFLSS